MGKEKRRFQISPWVKDKKRYLRYRVVMDDLNTKKCIIYCRVSSKDQVEGTSLETQERLCREFANRAGWNITKVFIEQGESAKSADRTEFTKAIALCSDKKQKINYFVVYKIDRFARNQDDHVTVRTILKKSGVELRSVTEPINDTPIGRAMEGVLSVFAEFDNNVRTERTKGGMLARVQEGIWVWRAPVGFYKPVHGKKSNIVPHPTIAPLIRLAFEEYAKGIYTFAALALFMAGKGLKTPNGKKIHPQLMEKMLRNPLYCGIIKTHDVEYPGSFDPIISRSLFLACQKNGRHKTALSLPRKTDRPEFPLRKFVICSECGKPISGSSPRGRHGKRYSYYHHSTKGCGAKKNIRKVDFEKAFTEYLAKITPDKRYEKLFKAVVIDIWKTNYKNIDQRNANARKLIEKLEIDRQRVFELHRAGTYSDAEFKEQKMLIGRRIDEQYEVIEEQRGEEFNMDAALNYCFDFVGNTVKKWLELENNYQARISFQKMIFKEKLSFDGEKFGTAKLSVVYNLKGTSLEEKSLLVAPWGFEPQYPE